MIRRFLLHLLDGIPKPYDAPSPEETAVELKTVPDPDGVQAFIDQVRWVIAFHDKRSDAFAQRAATILGFDGVIMSALIAGFTLIETEVDFHFLFVVNAVVVIVLPLLSALACLLVLKPRKVALPESDRLRSQWLDFIDADKTTAPAAQIVHSFLTGDQEPIASASAEAAERGDDYKIALWLLLAAVAGLGVLAGQVLYQQA